MSDADRPGDLTGEDYDRLFGPPGPDEDRRDPTVCPYCGGPYEDGNATCEWCNDDDRAPCVCGYQEAGS